MKNPTFNKLLILSIFFTVLSIGLITGYGPDIPKWADKLFVFLFGIITTLSWLTTFVYRYTDQEEKIRRGE